MSHEDRPGEISPWGPAAPQENPPPARERMFNAPWPSLVIVAAIIASYAVQTALPPDRADSLSFAPADLDHGDWLTLLSAMFIHVSWAHALINALSALAFGPPVARLMGGGWRGPLLFFLFYLTCGIVAGLGYAVMHLHSAQGAAGASGAIAGLMGAAARLLGPEARPIAPIRSQVVISLGASWLVINALMAVTGAPFMSSGVRIAWEAHIAGFVAGVLLIGPFARLAGWRPVARL